MKTAKKSTSAAKKPRKPKAEAASTKPARKRTKADAPAPEPELTEAEIAACAYFIYVSEGCPAGRELDHWLKAEAQLKNR